MTISVQFDLTAAEISDLLRFSSRNPIGKLLTRGMTGTRDRMIARLAGPTKIDIDVAGIVAVTNDDERRIPWSQVNSANERPGGWVFVVTPSGIVFVPKSAVLIEDRAAVSEELRSWAGKKYRVRDR